MAVAPVRSQTFDVASIKPSAPAPAGGPPRIAADAVRFVAAQLHVEVDLAVCLQAGKRGNAPINGCDRRSRLD